MSADLALLLPVDRYRIDYEIGTDVPFSEFDLTILRTVINDGATSLEKIAELLALPERLVIESLVGLARVGWLSIGVRAHGFSGTPLGRAALNDPQAFMPERLHTRTARVLVERVTGQVSSGRGLIYHTWKSLQDSGEWANFIPLPRDAGVPRVDMGSVKALLSRDKHEWIRHVGEPVLQQEVWVKLYVDANGVHGIPDAWRLAVSTSIARQFGRPNLLSVAADSPSRVLRSRSSHERSWRVSKDDAALVIGRREHAKLLSKSLQEAKSQVLIASAFVDAAVVENDLGPLILAATRRGVRVDLLWGYSAGDEDDGSKQRTLDALARLKRSCAGNNLLRFSETATGSHAKLLAWNTSDNTIQVCSGSYNWLSNSVGAAMADDTLNEVSLHTSNPGIAADFCTTLASLWTQADKTLRLAGSDLWQHTAAHLERKAVRSASVLPQDVEEPIELEGDIAEEASSNHPTFAMEPDAVELRQIRDQEHESLMREMLLAARGRIGVVSHKIGGAGDVRLSSLPRLSADSAGGLVVRVLVGELQADAIPLMQAVQAVVKDAGGTFALRPGLHAKILLADDAVLVSSYNFLSADPFGKSVNAREVGVLIKSSGICDEVWAWIEGMQQA